MKSPVRVSEEKTLSWAEEPRSIDRPNSSSLLSAGDLSNLRPSDLGAPQDPTKNCGSMDLSDGAINGKRRNNLVASLKLKCSVHLVAFNVCMLNQIELQVALE